MKKFITVFSFLLFFSNIFAQWQINSGAPATYFNDVIARNDTLYAANYNTGVYRSVNSGANWQQMNNGLNTSQSLNVYQLLLSGNILYAATADGIYKSANAGLNWVKKSTGIVVGGGALYAFCQSIFELNGTLFTGSYTGIYRSTDGAETWIPTNITGSAVIAKNFTLHNGILFAARETNNTPNGYKSTDNGVTWSTISNFNFPMITFLSEPGKLWAGTIHGAWLSTNDGASWLQRSSGLTADPYNSSFVRINGVLISSLKFGGSGIYKTTNDGLNWINFGEGLPFVQSIEKLYMYNGKILAATSAGIYQRNANEVITAIGTQSNEIPDEYALYQNYPNPFNPATKIKFSIPLSSGVPEERGVFVKLIVYDVSGKEISILVNNFLETGSFEINFDARSLSSGVYFYRLEAGEFTDTKRMVLIK